MELGDGQQRSRTACARQTGELRRSCPRQQPQQLNHQTSTSCRVACPALSYSTLGAWPEAIIPHPAHGHSGCSSCSGCLPALMRPAHLHDAPCSTSPCTQQAPTLRLNSASRSALNDPTSRSASSLACFRRSALAAHKHTQQARPSSGRQAGRVRAWGGLAAMRPGSSGAWLACVWPTSCGWKAVRA